MGACASSLETLNISGSPLSTLQYLPAELPALVELFAQHCSNLTSLAALTPRRCPELACLDATGMGADSEEALAAACSKLSSLPELADVSVTPAHNFGAAASSFGKAGQANEGCAPSADGARCRALLQRLLPQVSIINGGTRADVLSSKEATSQQAGCSASAAGDEHSAAEMGSSPSATADSACEAGEAPQQGDQGADKLAQRLQAFMSKHAISAEAWPAELSASMPAQANRTAARTASDAIGDHALLAASSQPENEAEQAHVDDSASHALMLEGDEAAAELHTDLHYPGQQSKASNECSTDGKGARALQQRMQRREPLTQTGGIHKHAIFAT